MNLGTRAPKVKPFFRKRKKRREQPKEICLETLVSPVTAAFRQTSSAAFRQTPPSGVAAYQSNSSAKPRRHPPDSTRVAPPRSNPRSHPPDSTRVAPPICSAYLSASKSTIAQPRPSVGAERRPLKPSVSIDVAKSSRT